MNKTGLLLINLGTPDGVDYWSVRRYLREFLGDRRVVEANRLLWAVVLNGVILTYRPRRSARAYAKVWRRDGDGSPLRYFTRRTAEGVAAAMAARRPEMVVDWAMCYGRPSIADRLDALSAAGCWRVLLFALYPQYSATTTAAAYDKAFDKLKTMRRQPAIRSAGAYAGHAAHIDALARGLRRHLDGLDWAPDVVLASFHGLPQDYVDRGDPYGEQCAATAAALRRAMGMDKQTLRLTFQSRVGRRAWLRPYTDETLAALPAEGARRVVAITPGFAADCLETLEEIGIAGRRTFLDAGGEAFSLVPCLNDSDDAIAMLTTLIEEDLAGW